MLVDIIDILLLMLQEENDLFNLKEFKISELYDIIHLMLNGGA